MAHLNHDDLAENNRRQIEEALGSDNRWYAGQHFGRLATDRECIWYYIEHGGAEGHRRRMEHCPPPRPESDQ